MSYKTVEKIARERSMTAEEAGKKINRSARTVRRLVALDRKDYLQKAADKRQKVANMRATGCSWAEIAKAVGTTTGGARSLFYQYIKKHQQVQAGKEEKLENLDLF